jgi:hypothetical protein
MNALWDHLAARAAHLGRPQHEVVRHHVLEGVLRRLAASPHAADFVLRGSMLTRAWVAPHPRMAEDLDFVGTFPHDVAETARRFRPILDIPSDDGVSLDPESFRVQGIWLKTAFPGVRLFLTAGFGCADRQLQIDVGFNDPLVPPACRLDYPALLSESPLRLWAVRPETAVAWKLHGLAEMGPLGWRPKDLYDLSLITETTRLIDADLAPAIEAAFSSRGYSIADAVEIFTAPRWWELKSARVKWREYLRSGPGGTDDLQGVVRRVHDRLRPAFDLLGAGSEGREQRR